MPLSGQCLLGLFFIDMNYTLPYVSEHCPVLGVFCNQRLEN